MTQQHSALMGLSPAQCLITGIPECELLLFGDITALMPRGASDDRRELYVWPLGTLELAIHYHGLGQLELPKGGQGVKTHSYQLLQQSAIMPARFKVSKAALPPAIVAATVHPTKQALLVLDTAGDVTRLTVNAAKIDARLLCRLKTAASLRPEAGLTLLVHQVYLLVTDATGCSAYHLVDGKACGWPLSAVPKLKAWQCAVGPVVLSGLWSPGAGAWQVRGKPVLEQADAMIDTAGSEGAALAAELCAKWDMSRAAGRYALDAVIASVAEDSMTPVPPASSPPRPQDKKPTENANKVVHELASMLVHVRLVELSPLLLITILGANPVLHEILLEEIRMYQAGLDETGKASSIPRALSSAPSYADASSALIKEYSTLAEAYDRTLVGTSAADVYEAVDVSANNREKVANLLKLSKSVSMSDDATRIAHEFGLFVEEAPADVLFCVLEQLNLLEALEQGFPNPATYGDSSLEGKTAKFMLFENPRLSWTTQTFEDATYRVCLFEILCQIIAQVVPPRLVPFVKFAAGVLHGAAIKPAQEQQVFTRAAECLSMAIRHNAALSKPSARAHADVLRHAGEHDRALRVLIGRQLWDDCIADVKRSTGDKVLHRQLFLILVQGLHSAGRLNAHAQRIFSDELLPASYRLEDLFSLFQQSAGAQGGEPIARKGGDETQLGSLRKYMVMMLQRVAKADSQANAEANDRARADSLSTSRNIQEPVVGHAKPNSTGVAF